MTDPPTSLSLPSSFPYPITITRIVATPGQTIKRGTRLLEYTFMSVTKRSGKEQRKLGGSEWDKEKLEDNKNDMSGTWESLIEGELIEWKDIKVGMVIEKRDSDRPLLTVRQPCSHPVQLHGMCGLCGADLIEDDYLSAPANRAGPSRHQDGYEIAHDAMGVTVSKNEAQRLENLSRNALLSARRLSLIVDLDQTIIHTTVDPTVGEWLDEIQSSLEHQEEGTTSPVSPSLDASKTTETRKNPNAEALKDVARFQIADDFPSGYVKMQGNGQGEARWYFTKPRPGLKRFLQDMSKFYEMHVYTMGTRIYADAICNVIDPEGDIFSGRILSRDESGSFSTKNLKRLFPTDTSMVVVIDDRSDVWGDCPNLVKVVPYDFFLGIGDINASFLPKNNSAPLPSSAVIDSSSSISQSSTASTTLSPLKFTTPEDVAGVSVVSEEEVAIEPTREEELVLKTKLLDQVSESRPLAKLQEKLEKENLVELEAKENLQNEEERIMNNTQASPAKTRKPLLNANDYELLRIAEILSEVHQRFYSAFDAIQDWNDSKKLPMSCDVEFIIPEIKSEVLEGCNIVFSGMIPREVEPSTTQVWQTAESFGALLTTNLTPRTTHLVTALLNTEKTYRASKMSGVKIVWGEWFWDSVALWKRMDEGKYLVRKGEVESTGGLGEQDVSSSENKLSVSPTEHENSDSDPEGEEDMDDPTQVGSGWDELADKEWEEFMADEDDWSDSGSTAENYHRNRTEGSLKTQNRSVPSTPSTPSKKRVRYADEEALPLENFKDPSPIGLAEIPPSKRQKPSLALIVPNAEHISEENFEEEVEEDSRSIAGTDDDERDDEFALLLMDSLADEAEKEVENEGT
ncbi:hypothetical protein L204_100032 [Cryptococcus depauperatus]|nr:hypothetical protein L204_02487 [Cryptococcus depauperatus CBS 7855]